MKYCSRDRNRKNTGKEPHPNVSEQAAKSPNAKPYIETEDQTRGSQPIHATLHLFLTT